jgi:hypothetical protein
MDYGRKGGCKVLRGSPPQQDPKSFEQTLESPMAADVKAYRPPSGEDWGVRRACSGRLGDRTAVCSVGALEAAGAEMSWPAGCDKRLWLCCRSLTDTWAWEVAGLELVRARAPSRLGHSDSASEASFCVNVSGHTWPLHVNPGA